jgi:eukaryotic-like serine/threonine-protein kinase
MLGSGTKLGPYQIVAPIGAGGMGEVYRARDSRLNRDVAIKVLPSAFSKDQERLHRFEQEALAAAALNHPNVLAVYDVGTENGAPYIVSELLDGETLRNRLQAGPLPVRKAVDYTAQIARGLAAAHSKGILHRDLKPENVFLTRDGQVKILDFGLAKLTSPHESGNDATRSLGSTPGMVVGTVGYISPEQARGKPADTRSDLFALGAILYETLTGERAFKGDTPADTLTAILTKDPPELATSGVPVPPMLDNIVRHCLEKQPEERFQSASDIVFDLQHVGLSSSSSLQTQTSQSKFNLRYILGALAAIALLTGGLLLGRAGHAPRALATFRQLTYRRGVVSAARFLPDGQTVVYSAAWNGGRSSLYTTRADLGGETPQGNDGELLSISSSGEMLVLRNVQEVFAYARIGELDQMPVAGGGPRPITDNVQDASWGPDGSIAVCRYVNQRYRLEYPLGKSLFETTGFLRAPRISPKNRQVAFLFHSDFGDDAGSVAVLDGEEHMRELTPRYNRINGLAWSPSGDELWFSAEVGLGKGGGLYAVNSKGQVRQLFAGPDQVSLFDIAPSGSVLLATQRETATPMFSGPELPADRDVAVSLWTIGMDMTPDGKYLLLDDETSENYTAVLAKSDGSPPVRLGENKAVAISPDGRWVLALAHDLPQQYMLLPTGAGEAKQITHDDITHTDFASWLPDSKHFLFTGSAPGHKRRGYLQNMSGGPARAVTPEGVSAGTVAPDGIHFVARDEAGNTFVESLDGSSPPRKLNLAATERVHGWLDSQHVYLYTPPRVTVAYSLDVNSGKRQVLARIAVPDPAGIDSIVPVVFGRDGKHFMYTVGRLLSDLHIVEGLK